MPLAYSINLRWRAVWIHLADELTPTRIADLLGMSERTVRHYLELFYQVGDVKPQPCKNGPDRLLGEFEQVVLLMLVLGSI